MRTCSYDGCARRHYALGLCQQHWHMKRTGQRLRPIRHRARGVCSVPECGRMRNRKGLCESHAKRHDRGEQLETVLTDRGGRERFDVRAEPAVYREVDRLAKEYGVPLARFVGDVLADWLRVNRKRRAA